MQTHHEIGPCAPINPLQEITPFCPSKGRHSLCVFFFTQSPLLCCPLPQKFSHFFLNARLHQHQTLLSETVSVPPAPSLQLRSTMRSRPKDHVLSLPLRREPPNNTLHNGQTFFISQLLAPLNGPHDGYIERPLGGIALKRGRDAKIFIHLFSTGDCVNCSCIPISSSPWLQSVHTSTPVPGLAASDGRSLQ